MQEWVDDDGQEIYHLAHNEHSRPTYRIYAIAELPEHLTWQL